MLLNFKKMILALNSVDVDLEDSNSKDFINRKGTKQELLMYLIQEVGGSVELSWRSSLFFV